MGDPNLYGHDEGVSVGSRPPAQYKFSQDELRVLQECNAESFLQRSLPLGTVFGLSAFFGVQKGHLKPNPRFGAVPKVTLAVIVGYFLGKLSYQQACAEKLMALPDSYIGQLLRDKKEGRTGGHPPTSHTPSLYGIKSEDIYSDAGPGSSLNLDTDRPLFNDDSFRPGSEGPSYQTPDAVPQQPTQSYEELRRKNRGEYNNARQDPYKVESNPVPPVTRSKPQQKPTNQYGDVME